MTSTADAPTRPRVEHAVEIRGGAARVWASRDPEIVLSGPAGTGKSRALLEKIHAAALKYPGMRALMVRKTLTSLGSTGLVTWREQVVKEALEAGILRFHGGSKDEAAAYRYANGSRIVVGGMDKPSKIMSSEYDLIFVQEAIELTLDEWEALLTRLRNGRLPYQQLIADTNPSMPTHWLKLRADAGMTVMHESRHEDNPALFDEPEPGRFVATPFGAQYIATLDRLTGVRHQRLRKGLWVAAEGLVYEEFDPALHVVPWFAPPPSWPRFWTVDFGFQHALVIQCWAVDGDGRLYLYREVFRRKLLVQDAVEMILDAVAPVNEKTGEREWREPRPTAVYTDHDAEDRATFERHIGFATTAAYKSVTEGIQAVSVRLRPDETGRPGIYLMADAVLHGRQQSIVDAGQPASTVEEFAGYVWDTGGGRKVTEQPIKIFDDGLDALRYAVASVDLTGTPGVRWLD